MQYLKKDIDYTLGDIPIDCYTLDKLLKNHNWDDGFDLPEKIIKHPNCELATALEAFYLAEGYIYLEDRTSLVNNRQEEWDSFWSYLYERITNGCYSRRLVGFKVPLTKVQKYKLLKAVPDTPMVFLEDIAGSKTTERCEQCALVSNIPTASEFEVFCPYCGVAYSLAGDEDDEDDEDDEEYCLRCPDCNDYNVVTTFFRPCYVNDTAPRKEFSKYVGCHYRV